MLQAQPSNPQRRPASHSPWWLPVADAVAALTAFLVATSLRGFPDAMTGDKLGFLTYFLVSAGGLIVLAYSRRLYQAMPGYFSIHDAIEVFKIVVVSVGLGCLAAFIVHRMDAITRSVIVVHSCLLLFLMLGIRGALRRWEMRSWKSVRWDDVVNVLVVGINPTAALYIDAVASLGQPFIRVAGVVSERSGFSATRIRGQRILGALGATSSVVTDLESHGVRIHRVVVALAESSLTRDEHEELEAVAKRHGVELEYLNDLLRIPNIERRRGAELNFLWREDWYPVIRRIGDISVSALLLTLSVPLLLLTAVMVIVDVGRPVVFWQERPGRFGVPFRLYKFRTMAGPTDRSGQPRPEDKRTSPIGAFIRRYRLDELLQLANVFTGAMSLVGPRPLLASDQPADFDRRLSVRPGITGWAQVNGGRVITLAEKSALDYWYTEHASVLLDVKIILLTARMLVLGDRRNDVAVGEAMEAAAARERRAAATFIRPVLDRPAGAPIRVDQFVERRRSRAATPADLQDRL